MRWIVRGALFGFFVLPAIAAILYGFYQLGLLVF